MFVHSYHWFTKGLDCDDSKKSPNSNCSCKSYRERNVIDVFVTVYIWRLLLMVILPVTIIITVNLLIMGKLFNKNSLADHNNATENCRQKMKLVYRISRMLLIVTSVYLFLHLPGSIHEIIKHLYFTKETVCKTKFVYYMKLTYDIFDFMTNLNYGINFYLYIISGKHIRNELIRFCRSRLYFKGRVDNEEARRSSNFLSYYSHTSKQGCVRLSNVQSSRRPTGSSLHRFSSL